MPIAGWFAALDAVVAVGLLLSVPRQRRNKRSVVAVAVVLLGISCWLALLVRDEPRVPSSPGFDGPVASDLLAA
jgi:hypothetical protein